MNRNEAQTIIREIEDRCNLPEKGRENVLWLEDAKNWVEGKEGFGIVVSVSQLDGKQIHNSILVAYDNQKEIQVASRDDKAIMIIYTP